MQFCVWRDGLVVPWFSNPREHWYHPENWLKHRWLGPNPWVFESVCLGWRLRICISHRVPGDLLLLAGDYSLRPTRLGSAVASYSKGLFLAHVTCPCGLVGGSALHHGSSHFDTQIDEA